MKKGNIIEYFIDITFKIVPKCYRPYKLMTIATLDNENNKTILIAFVLFINIDNILYLKIFKFLNEIYNFNPIIIHTDYERAIELALKKCSFLKNSIINLKCFFHFAKTVREKLKTFTNNKKFLTKENYVILKNIELICFIEENKIELYKKFINKNLKALNVSINFINYLNKFWFIKNNGEFNYLKFIEKYRNNVKALNKLYITNNIIESLHHKLTYNVPKCVLNKYNFINSMKNIFTNDIIKHNIYKRYDYITQALLLMINKKNINNKFKWFDNTDFENYLKMVIKDKDLNINVDNLIKMIQIESENYNTNDFNNNIDNIYHNNDIYISKYLNLDIETKKHIGLKNLGATCYLNSLIQVLFHIIKFRESILKWEVNDEPNNSLNELEIIFDALKSKKNITVIYIVKLLDISELLVKIIKINQFIF